MTDAPERIWAAYPTSGNRVGQTIYGYGIEPFGPNDDTWIDDDFDDPCMVAEYTRTDISQARIAELEEEVRTWKRIVGDIAALIPLKGTIGGTGTVKDMIKYLKKLKSDAHTLNLKAKP
jgi:hypothetical protein